MCRCHRLSVCAHEWPLRYDWYAQSPSLPRKHCPLPGMVFGKEGVGWGPGGVAGKEWK